MKEKIFAFLKTKLANFAGGVEDAFLLEYADHFSKSITEETAIATTLTDGVIDQMKVAYGFYNKEVVNKTAKAQETALKKFREKHGLDENGKPIEDPAKKKTKEVSDPDEPGWFTNYKKQQEELVSGLKTKLEKQEEEKAASALVEKVKSHEKMKDIPASFLKGRNLAPKSEAEIDQLVATVEADYNGFKQEMADKGVVISVPPSGGGAPKEGADAGKKIAEKRNANTSEGVTGKKI